MPSNRRCRPIWKPADCWFSHFRITGRCCRGKQGFSIMLKSCLKAIIEVIDQQHKKHFSWDLDKKLKEETKSARSHNVDAKEIIRMFSAAKKCFLNATLCYLSCQLQAEKTGQSHFWTAFIPMRKKWCSKKQYHLGAKKVCQVFPICIRNNLKVMILFANLHFSTIFYDSEQLVNSIIWCCVMIMVSLFPSIACLVTKPFVLHAGWLVLALKK